MQKRIILTVIFLKKKIKNRFFSKKIKKKQKINNLKTLISRTNIITLTIIQRKSKNIFKLIFSHIICYNYNEADHKSVVYIKLKNFNKILILTVKDLKKDKKLMKKNLYRRDFKS